VAEVPWSHPNLMGACASPHQHAHLPPPPAPLTLQVMADPDLAMLMSKPNVMTAIAECTQNPMAMAKYQNDAEASPAGGGRGDQGAAGGRAPAGGCRGAQGAAGGRAPGGHRAET
jgi:hypothetical protein